jgi:hypothetical protein
MDLIRTELIVGTLIAERRREARHQELIDAFTPVGPASAFAGRLGRLLVRIGHRLESIECDRSRVPIGYAVGTHATD